MKHLIHVNIAISCRFETLTVPLTNILFILGYCEEITCLMYLYRTARSRCRNVVLRGVYFSTRGTVGLGNRVRGKGGGSVYSTANLGPEWRESAPRHKEGIPSK
jgi:hypothetical protein